MNNCDTCRFDQQQRWGRACDLVEVDNAVADWADRSTNPNGDPKPGAASCPGWKPHYQRSQPLPDLNPKPRKKGSTPR